LLILTSEGIYAARDKYGRTPIVIGKKKDSFAMATETTSFSNLGYMTDYFMGPGEILKITADSYEQIKPPETQMQICAFLWVYYGYPASSYEGINVDVCRYNCGKALAANDDTEADFISGIPTQVWDMPWVMPWQEIFLLHGLS
jgi:amidophosphoribosyltransferase